MGIDAKDLARLTPVGAAPRYAPVAINTKPRRFGRGVRRSPGTMNKTEARYAQHLESKRVAGEILWYKFEGITLKLAPDTRYTPDFVVMLADGIMRMDDVKGFMEDDAWVKIKVAAEMFPFAFQLVYAKAQKHGGGWDIKSVG